MRACHVGNIVIIKLAMFHQIEIEIEISSVGKQFKTIIVKQMGFNKVLHAWFEHF